MAIEEKSIGVFDSGIGGLTVLKELLEVLPAEDFIYFGDTARVPYGPRPVEEIREFTGQILEFLAGQKIKLAVIACNTITFSVMPQDLAAWPFPVIGMDDSVKTAIAASKTKHIGVIATQATVASAKHFAAGEKIDPAARIYLQSCPEFVPLIERGIFDGTELEAAALEYLRPLRNAEIDTLILACTHYPLIEPVLVKIMGPDVKIINPARETALNTQRLLAEKHLLRPAKKTGKLRLIFSAVSSETAKLTQLFLRRPLPRPELYFIKN